MYTKVFEEFHEGMKEITALSYVPRDAVIAGLRARHGVEMYDKYSLNFWLEESSSHDVTIALAYSVKHEGEQVIIASEGVLYRTPSGLVFGWTVVRDWTGESYRFLIDFPENSILNAALLAEGWRKARKNFSTLLGLIY